MDSLEDKEVLDDASAFVHELEENSEYKTTSTRKKLVEKHYVWKAETYKGMPSNSNSIQIDENGNLIRPKYISNHRYYFPKDSNARETVKPGKAK